RTPISSISSARLSRSSSSSSWSYSLPPFFSLIAPSSSSNPLRTNLTHYALRTVQPPSAPSVTLVRPTDRGGTALRCVPLHRLPPRPVGIPCVSASRA